MCRLIALAALICGLFLPTLGMSREECEGLWSKADAGKNGVLSDSEASRYLSIMRVRGPTPPSDGRFQHAAFLDQCKNDAFRIAAVEPPFSGANSFTESQVEDRAMAAGYTAVSDFRKDAGGIWRGSAAIDGRRIELAVDYEGNVVAIESST